MFEFLEYCVAVMPTVRVDSRLESCRSGLGVRAGRLAPSSWGVAYSAGVSAGDAAGLAVALVTQAMRETV